MGVLDGVVRWVADDFIRAVPDLFRGAFDTFRGLEDQVVRIVECALDPERQIEALTEVVKVAADIATRLDGGLGDLVKDVGSVLAEIGVNIEIAGLIDHAGRLVAFFKDLKDGLLEIDVQEWLPIALHLVVAVAAFASGDVFTGTVALLKAAVALNDLCERHPELFDAYGARGALALPAEAGKVRDLDGDHFDMFERNFQRRQAERMAAQRREMGASGT